MTALHVIATEWLREHPEYHIHGAHHAIAAWYSWSVHASLAA